jgi:hypothetical protein
MDLVENAWEINDLSSERGEILSGIARDSNLTLQKSSPFSKTHFFQADQKCPDARRPKS